MFNPKEVVDSLWISYHIKALGGMQLFQNSMVPQGGQITDIAE
jgi:hypothetical protein